MIKRYPHRAKLIVPVKVDTNDRGILGRDTDDEDPIILYGRFEHRSGLDLGYKAKFFLDSTRKKVKEFTLDNTKLEYQGKQWEVIRVISSRTNTVLWLN